MDRHSPAKVRMGQKALTAWTQKALTAWTGTRLPKCACKADHGQALACGGIMDRHGYLCGKLIMDRH